MAGNARPSWSASGRRRRGPPPRRSGSRSATSATCSMVAATPWLTVVFAVAFAAWALYVALVEHPARLSIDPVPAVAQFRANYRLAALYHASLAALGLIGGLVAAANGRVGRCASD